MATTTNHDTSSELVLHKAAEAAYQGIKSAFQFAEDEIQPVLLAQLNLSERENLIRTLWLRVYMWLKTAAALAEPHLIQGIRGPRVDYSNSLWT